jgi:hypothetical protein
MWICRQPTWMSDRPTWADDESIWADPHSGRADRPSVLPLPLPLRRRNRQRLQLGWHAPPSTLRPRRLKSAGSRPSRRPAVHQLSKIPGELRVGLCLRIRGAKRRRRLFGLETKRRRRVLRRQEDAASTTPRLDFQGGGLFDNRCPPGGPPGRAALLAFPTFLTEWWRQPPPFPAPCALPRRGNATP